LSERKSTRRKVEKGANRMPSNSLFYERIVPIILIGLGAIMLILILVAAGILIGII
jgi:hypothetical protein